VWCTATQRCVGLGSEHTDSIGSVNLSQKTSSYGSKQAFAVSGAADKVIKRWPLPVPSFVSVAGDMSGKKAPVMLVASHSVRAHEKDINCIAVAPNDSIIASASHDKTIRIWRASDLFSVATLRGHKRGVWCVKFSPVDRELLSCSGDRTIKTWSLVDFSCTRSFEGHGASVLSVGYIREGQQIISTSTDGLVKLWTIRTGECETTMDQHEDRIWALATGDGRGDAFFTGGSDSMLQLWEDTTEKVEEERLKEQERILLIEQQMSNDIRDGKYDKVT
jgi:U3 small nucleolar RNA-associated protein 13